MRWSATGLVVAGLVLVGCSSSSEGSSNDPAVQKISVTLTDAGCEPNSLSASAGPVTFEVTNDGTAAVSEFEVLSEDGSSIVGERENIAPGLSGDVSLTLQAGTYQTYCPGGSKEYGTLEVAESGTGETADPGARG